MTYVASRAYRDNYRYSDEEEEDNDDVLAASLKVYKHRSVHSTTAREMINLCRDERGKWRWPVNGADLVYPGIYLGDETTALCTGLVVSMALLPSITQP